MKPPSRIALVGFMGSGKSTAGRLLAAHLGYRFEDVDERIEAIAQAKISTIFELRGEGAFRETERQAVHELLLGSRTVIATGGGAFAQPACAAELLARAFTVHLSCDFVEAYARVANGIGRPLVEKGESAMAALYAERKDKYARAHATVDTTRLAPGEVVNEVLALLPLS